jgi:hypothetical protein
MWRQPPAFRRPIHYFMDDAGQLVILFDYSVPHIARSEYPFDFTRILKIFRCADSLATPSAPELCEACPQKREGAGKCRMPKRTRSVACKIGRKNTRKSSQVRRTFWLSLRDGLRLMARSPRGAGLDSPRHLAKRSSQNLTSASGGQDHVRGAASLVLRRSPLPPLPASRFVAIGRNVPLDEAGWRHGKHDFRFSANRLFRVEALKPRNILERLANFLFS